MFKQRKGKEIPPINTTALPDIIFMLLFFFMVVTVLKKDESSKAIKVPLVHFAEFSKGKNLVQVSIQEDNGAYIYFINNRLYEDIKTLETALTTRFRNSESHKIILTAHKSIPMQKINVLKNAFQRARYYNIEYMAVTSI